MEIVIGVGLGEIIFGMREADVIRLLGQPDKSYASEYDNHFQYFELGVDFWFLSDRDDPDDGRLHWLECVNLGSVLFGVNVVGKPRDEVLTLLKGQLGDDIEFEDYGSFESHHFRISEIELQVEYGVVQTVNFGHLWKTDNDRLWPVV